MFLLVEQGSLRVSDAFDFVSETTQNTKGERRLPCSMNRLNLSQQTMNPFVSLEAAEGKEESDEEDGLTGALQFCDLI